MIDFVRLALARNVIDTLFHNEGRLAPTCSIQSAAKALRSAGFAAAASDNFLNWNSEIGQRSFDFSNSMRKVVAEDCPCVSLKSDLETFALQCIEHCVTVHSAAGAERLSVAEL